MNKDELDKIVQDAVEKKHSRYHRPDKHATVDRVRTILNVVFMIGAVVAIIAYFVLPDKTLFFYVGGIALCLKVIEFFIRFML